MEIYDCAYAEKGTVGRDKIIFCTEKECPLGYQAEKGRIKTCQTRGVISSKKVLEVIASTIAKGSIQ